MDGKARCESQDRPNVLMFLDDTVTPEAQFLGFNLRDSSQTRFSRIKDLKTDLRENLERHFKLTYT